jgi:HEAT repeat protein
LQKDPTKESIKKLSKQSQTIIGRLLSASKNLKLYPASHPITKRIITAAFSKLKETLEESDYLSFSLAGNVLLINEKTAVNINKQTLDSFLTALGKRKIGRITFIKGVDMDEFKGLIEIMGIEPEDIEKMGGINRLVIQKSIHNITISGLSFGEDGKEKELGIDWKDLLSLISDSDDFIQKIEQNPEEFSKAVKESIGGQGEGSGWGQKIEQAVGNVAVKLFEKYEETDIKSYTDTIAKLILVLSPEMQSQLLFSKPDVPLWDSIVDDVVNSITASELGDIIAEETKKQSETLVIGGEEGAGVAGDVTESGGGTGVGVEQGKGSGRGKGIGGGIGDGIGPGVGTSQGAGKGYGGGSGTGTGAGGDSGTGSGTGPSPGGDSGTVTGLDPGFFGGSDEKLGEGKGEGRGRGIGGGIGDGIGTGVDRGKKSETVQGKGKGGGSGRSKISEIDSFLTKFIDKSNRKKELIPAIRKSLKRRGVKDSVLDYFSGGSARKEFLNVIERDLMATGVNAEALVGIRNLIQKNASIEELLKSLIELLNNKDPDVRCNVVTSFTDLTEKLILLGRIDLLKLIVAAFSERLGRETDKTVFGAIINALPSIAIRMIKEGKSILAEKIDDLLENYLKILGDEERLKLVIKALSKIGDSEDAKALNVLIYGINRDIAFQIITEELKKKGEKIFPLLLKSLKAIEDKITRIRILSLVIDTAKEVPEYDAYLKLYIDDPKWYVRRNIAMVLGEIGDKKSLKLLSRMIEDAEPKVRMEAVQSIGKIESEESEIMLIESLNDKNTEVVTIALQGLKKVGTEMCIFALKGLLEKQTILKKEQLLKIQKKAISALCSVGSEQTVNIFRKIIFDKNILGRYKYDNKIRLLCVEGLGKIDTERSKHLLERVAWLKNQEVGKRAKEILDKTIII